MAQVQLREGILDRIQRLAGITSDQGMAGAIGMSVETYRRVKSGEQEPSLRFLAGLGGNFGYQLGEIAQLIPDKTDNTREEAA